mgnify:CR=1 FL=1
MDGSRTAVGNQVRNTSTKRRRNSRMEERIGTECIREVLFIG